MDEGFELDPTMQRYVEIKAEIKALKFDQDELRTLILTHIKLNDIENYDNDVNSLKFVMQKRKSFNKNKAVEMIDALYTEKDEVFDSEVLYDESESEVLKIKQKEVRKDE